MARVSFSQYSTWMSCPYQYKLSYIDKLGTNKSNISLIFCTAMHEIIQSYVAEEQKELAAGIKASFIRRLVKNTLLKGKVKDFVNLYKKAGLSARDFNLLFKKYTYRYSPVVSTQQPLYNNFNFCKK